MNEEQLQAGDKLLDAWLNLTSTLWNTRLVVSMPYNEAHVLGLLLRHCGEPMTATDLIHRTYLLKSQMNKLLTSLESKGFITRVRAKEDKRRIEIRLTPEGVLAYREEHKRVEAILQQLTGRIGAQRALDIAQDLSEIVTLLDDILTGF
ncbi:MAG: MarR family transcriptional regulator [Clostridiales bacterium]|nr:MarR family transcriptional regulator [Clostridiales bacterium]